GLNITTDFEKRGNIVVEVTVSYTNYIKKCTIKKPFFVVRLLPAPFWKFTLFASRGASVAQSDVNRLAEVADDGKTTGAPPLILFNRLLNDKSANQADLDFFNVFVDPNTILPNSQALEESGWVYLGGFGKSNDNWKDSKNTGDPNSLNNLTLNVLSGTNGPFDQGYYGEGFHYFFTNESFGWLCADDYSAAINQLNGADKSVSVAYNDFGFFKGQRTAKFGPSGQEQDLFKPLYDALKTKFPQEVFDHGSALHLFGTPNLCTPTLVFGKVKRRFLRTYGFLFNAPGFNRVYPLRVVDKQAWDNGVIAAEVAAWLTSKGLSAAATTAIDNAMANIWPTPIGQGPLDGAAYTTGFPPNFPPLQPGLKDDEPYMMGLKNIKSPRGPEKPWQTVFSGFKYIDKGPEALLDSSYSFTADPELDYSGSISSIKPPQNYLRDKVSYEISDSSLPKPMQLSQIPFLTTGSDAILDITQTPHIMSLHQVIAVDGDLVIDKPIVVAQGGIILVNGEITIKAPIINPFIHNFPNPPTSPHMFGYLTLVSEKGIRVELEA
ncbi:MAG TPA: hypothetical protein PKO06_20335, partial [Candidatus Ozemobacteraceae bacterium]|nr:hypothetical protein [Candidatus Ozemobacteraceae bacterium]